MGCASSKKRTTSIEDLTGQGKNKEPTAQLASSDKNKNGQVGTAANDSKPIKKESSHQTSSAPPPLSDTSAIQIPGTHKSFLAPDGIPFIDEDVEEDAEAGGSKDVNSIPVDNNAAMKPDVNKNVVKAPAVPEQKPQEQPQNPAPVPVKTDDDVKTVAAAAVAVDERRSEDVPPELPASEPPSEPSEAPAEPAAVADSTLSEEQAEEARKREIALEILSKELDMFSANEQSATVTSITVTESEPVAAETLPDISQPVRSVTPDDQEKAAVKIQAGIRGYRDRQRVKAIRAAQEASADTSTATASSATEATSNEVTGQEVTGQEDDQPVVSQIEASDSQDKPAEDADSSGVRISVECEEPNPNDVVVQDDDPDDPEKQKAAVKIQASFKGYKTRKELGKIKK